MFKLIAIPLGFLMQLCYRIIKDYGIALFAFTFIIKLILLPLQIKQQKSTAKMQKYQPELDKIKKKYGNDNQKYQQKMTEFYAKEGISPTGGCLPMIISMLVLFSLIYVVYQPLYYVLNDIDNDRITEASVLTTNLYTVCYDIDGNEIDFDKLVEMYDADKNNELSAEEKEKLVDDLSENAVKDSEGKELDFKTTSKIKEAEVGDEDVSKKSQLSAVIDALMMCREGTGDGDGRSLYSYMLDESKVSTKLKERPELVIINLIKDGYTAPFEAIDKDLVTEVKDFNYTLLGFNLGVYPSLKNVTVLIPVLSFVAQLACTFVSQYFQKKNNSAAQLGTGMKLTLYIMPVFSLFIAFGFPAGLGIYWIYSSVFALLQTVLLNIIYTPARIDAIVEKEMASSRKKRKTMIQKMIEVQNETGVSNKYIERMNLKDDDDDDDESEDAGSKKLSKAEQKELQRKKLNEARRRIAEKYGDEYNEDDQ